MLPSEWTLARLMSSKTKVYPSESFVIEVGKYFGDREELALYVIHATMLAGFVP